MRNVVLFFGFLNVFCVGWNLYYLATGSPLNGLVAVLNAVVAIYCFNTYQKASL